jgi:hypothetical protein
MLQQFMIQNPPFYMPPSYLMNQQPGQNLGYFGDQQMVQNGDMNFGGAPPLLNFHQPPPPPQIQQLLRSVDQEELEK